MLPQWISRQERTRGAAPALAPARRTLSTQRSATEPTSRRKRALGHISLVILCTRYFSPCCRNSVSRHPGMKNIWLLSPNR